MKRHFNGLIRLRNYLASGLLVGAIAGCAVTTDYHSPDVGVPAQWRAAAPDHGPIAQSAAAWWTLFHDRELTSLIERAVQTNLDVQLARMRLREVRTQRRMAAGSFSPTLKATLSTTREKESSNAPAPVLREPDGSIETPSGQPDNLFQAGFDAHWELDLFGGRQRTMEAARAGVEGTTFERDIVTLTLLSEVARTYITLRATQQQIALATASLAAHNDLAQLARARYAGGMTAYGDVARATQMARRTAAALPSLQSGYQSAANRLCILLGQWPGALDAELMQGSGIPTASADFSTGLPSDLLRQRPDILRAERNIAIASARVGIATADLYPRFSLSGAAGLASVSARDFFSSASLFWKIGPTLTWPILQRGQLVATIEIRDLQQQAALIIYRKTILLALEDVNNAIDTYHAQIQRHAALIADVVEVEQAAQLAHSRYVGGLTDYREVDEAETTMLQAKTDLAQSDAALATALVTLYKALGGGWQAPTVASHADRRDQPAACHSDAAKGMPSCSTSP